MAAPRKGGPSAAQAPSLGRLTCARSPAGPHPAKAGQAPRKRLLAEQVEKLRTLARRHLQSELFRCRGALQIAD